MRQMISSQSKQRSEQTSSAYSLILEMLKETEKVLILTFSVVTVGVLPLKQQPGDFAASCHDKRSH